MKMLMPIITNLFLAEENPVLPGFNFPWYGYVIAAFIVVLIIAVFPWKKIAKKNNKPKIKEDDKNDINLKEKKYTRTIQKENVPIYGMFNGFGKKEAIRVKKLVWVQPEEDSCSLCQPFENTIICLEDYDKNHTTMKEAISKGYHHIGCKHVDVDYFKKVTLIPNNPYTNETQKVRHQLVLEQYKFEDKIRKIKFEINNNGDNIKEKKEKLIKIEKEFEQFLSNNSLQRNKNRESEFTFDIDKFQ